MEVSGQLHSRPLYPRYPFCRRLSGSQNGSGSCGEDKNLLSLQRIEPQFLGRPTHCLVAIRDPTELVDLIRGCCVRISAGTSATLTRGISWFSSVPQSTFNDSTPIRPWPLLSKSFLIPNSSDIQPSDATQIVPGGKVSILGGYIIRHPKQESVYVHVSYSERFPR
jgi:hypothetical protein